MCGRFSQAYTWEEIVAFSQPLTVPANRPNLRARYNISPTTEVDMIVLVEGNRELWKARWGLIPGWWKKSARETGSTFNARINSSRTPDDDPTLADPFEAATELEKPEPPSQGDLF